MNEDKKEKKYYWMIVLNVLIILFVSFYFHLITPKRVLPDSCVFRKGIECTDFKIIGGTDGSLYLKLKNEAGQTIAVKQISIYEPDQQYYNEPPLCSIETPLSSWKGGQVSEFNITGCDFNSKELSTGKKAKMVITLIYNTETVPTSEQELLGEIYGEIRGVSDSNVVRNIANFFDSPLFLFLILFGCLLVLDDIIIKLSQKEKNIKETLMISLKIIGKSVVVSIIILIFVIYWWMASS